MYLDRQTPPKTLNQSHIRRKGVVNHVPGLKRKACPGTLKPLRLRRVRWNGCLHEARNHCAYGAGVWADVFVERLRRGLFEGPATIVSEQPGGIRLTYAARALSVLHGAMWRG
jgi:hypothetical protein